MNNNLTEKMKKNILITSFSLLIVLLVLIIYLSYIQIIQGPSLYTHQLNRRATELTKQIERGRIIDRTGKVLAFSEKQSNSDYRRIYPYREVFAHLIGYDSIKYGKSGIEGALNGYLTGITNPQHRLGALEHLWRPVKGDDVELTVDQTIQETAYKALGNQKGAIVAINPRTGAVLALVSKPSYDPNIIEQNWSSISKDSSSPMLNRAVQGLYPPGSTLKVMIAEAVLKEKVTDTHEIFTCNGSLKIGKDYVLSESHNIAHGKINLEEALAESCNVTFGQITMKLGRDRLANTFTRYGFDRTIDGEFAESASHLPKFSNLTDGELAQTGIGQGSLLTTPLKMAMLASVFANNGVIMKPFLVNRIIAPDGSVIMQTRPEEWLKPAEPDLANMIGKMMTTVITSGTGSKAGLSGITVAGKTGTAENPHGDSHAWFIGFAPAENPQIAIAIIVENGGSGGAVAAPIARQIFSQALLRR